MTVSAFAPFGEVIAAEGADARTINDGCCVRFHDLAAPEALDGRPGISVFRAELRSLPYALTLMERHPMGSQCFVPMDGADWLVIVADDAHGAPAAPRAFRASGRQGVNIARGVWHGVLCPLGGSGLFAVIDRIGPGANLEEAAVDPAIEITA